MNHFQNLFAGANGKRDNNTNERGIRVMMELPVFNRWTLNVSWDYYEYPWLTYGNISPVRGMDIRTDILYKDHSFGNYSFTYRYRQNNLSSGNNLGWTDKSLDQQKHQLKVKSSFQLSRQFSMLLRTSYALTERIKEGFRSGGACLATDVHFHPPEIAFKIVGRFAVFNTDDYESRLYIYENDVLYSSSMPAYYGKGSRYYLLVKYSPVVWLDSWLRFSMTVYTDRSTISSGHDEIQGNKLPEIKLQIRLKM